MKSILLFLLLFAGQCFAYNGGAFPFTEIDSHGNYFSGGYKKSLIYVDGNFRALEVLGPVTGGLLEGKSRALLCTNSAIYDLDSSYHFVKRPETFEDLKCSTWKDRFAYVSKGILYLSGGSNFSVGSIHSLIHNYFDFFVVYKDGSISKITEKGLVPVIGNIGALDSKSVVKMSDDLVMRVDENGLYRYQIEGNRLSDKVRLPISSCTDNELCGLSIAADKSYLVSGYWGIWHGLDQNFKRVTSIPNLSQKGGRSSISHTGMGGSYIYIGDDDADIGKLKKLEINPPALHSSKRVVWLKTMKKDQLFSWSPQKNVRSSVIIQDENEPLPKDWAAYESDTLVSTPLEDPQAGLLGHQSAPLGPETAPWWRNRMNLPAIEDLLKDKPKYLISIGVIDTGITLNHPGLKGQIAINPNEIPNNQIDDDQNGMVDDYLGYDFVHDDSSPDDEHGHGTHVSGLIAGRFADGSPMGPSADNARLVIAKGLGSSGNSNSIDLARAVAYAVSRKVDILNCSWGGGFATQVLEDALSFAVESGVIVMMSAGNSSLDQDKSPEFPKGLPGLTLVASSNPSNTKSKSSNFGSKSVAWAVPGDEMYSTTKDGEFGMMSGTSMANGLSSGLVGLALSHSEIDRPSFLKNLCDTADQKGWKDKTRCGHLDLTHFFKVYAPFSINEKPLD
ncbi:MAG: S8 family serine peptidase [Pseudomonadota bacterium]